MLHTAGHYANLDSVVSHNLQGPAAAAPAANGHAASAAAAQRSAAELANGTGRSSVSPLDRDSVVSPTSMLQQVCILQHAAGGTNTVLHGICHSDCSDALTSQHARHPACHQDMGHA